MDAQLAYEHYAKALEAAETPTWRTVYALGLMCAGAVALGKLVTFVGSTAQEGNWPDPSLTAGSKPMKRKED
jgi:hypothetical protein